MVQVIRGSNSRICISSGSSNGSFICSRDRDRLRLSLHTWIMIVTGAIFLCLFRIESIIYDDIFYHRREAEEVRILRYKVFKSDDHDQYDVYNNSSSNNNNNSRFESGRSNKNSKFNTRKVNNDGKPVARNGFISRGLLRTPMIITSLQQPQGSSMTFDHFEIERMEYDVRRRHRAANSRDRNKKNLLIPRIIELDDQLNVMITPITTVTTKSIRTMELKDIEQVVDNNVNDDNDTIILDFERPWNEECEPVLTQPLQPIVHPTCNGIHELPSLTTLDIDSSLLSMKGSWRSVWKVSNNDAKHRQQLQQQEQESDDNTSTMNETSSSLLRNATTSRKMTTSSHRSVVLKMLHLHRQFDRESFEAHATDIMVMDQLTASPHVVNAYGFCGQTVVTEFAELSGRDFVKRYDIGSQERLRVARDLARGLADIQALQPLPHDTYISTSSDNNTDTDTGGTYDDTPDIPIVFAHNDITIANTIMIDGRIKWNDFNIGVFMREKKQRWVDSLDSKLDLDTQRRHERLPSIRSTSIASNNADKNVNIVPPSITTRTSSFTAFTDTNRDKVGNLCPAPVKYRSDLWRSPEEIKNTSYVQLTQSDVYGLGNILYQTMTRHQPWSFKEPGGVLTVTDVAERKMNGTVPTIPEQYLNTTKRSLQTMFAATNICYYSTPNRRPTARRLAYGLGSLYNKIKYKERVTRPIILDYLVQPRK